MKKFVRYKLLIRARASVRCTKSTLVSAASQQDAIKPCNEEMRTMRLKAITPNKQYEC